MFILKYFRFILSWKGRRPQDWVGLRTVWSRSWICLWGSWGPNGWPTCSWYVTSPCYSPSLSWSSSSSDIPSTLLVTNLKKKIILKTWKLKSLLTISATSLVWCVCCQWCCLCLDMCTTDGQSFITLLGTWSINRSRHTFWYLHFTYLLTSCIILTIVQICQINKGFKEAINCFKTGFVKSHSDVPVPMEAITIKHIVKLPNPLSAPSRII